MADIHEDDRKLFVGALPQEAKEEDIREYFGQFGEIENINLKIDQMTGRSRGFAFLVFKDVSALDGAMANNAHVVKGKKVTCKKAEAKQGKIFVGKLPPGDALSKEDIQAHFAQYGEVVEVTRPIDKNKNNEPKGFGFVTFAREQVARDLVKQGETTIGEHTVEIKKVTPKDPNNMGYGAGAQMGWGFDPYGYGGFGGYGDFGGYGGYGGGGPGGWGGAPGGGFGGPAGGKMRGAGGRGRGGRGRGRPY